MIDWHKTAAWRTWTNVEQSRHYRTDSTLVESIKNTSMENEKIRNNIQEVKIRPKNDMMCQDIYNCICQNTKKNEDMLSIMSNLQPNCCLKVDFQKMDQHVGHYVDHSWYTPRLMTSLRLTKAYDVTIQRYRNSHAKIGNNKMHILWCMGSKFCVKFQRCPLKFHTKFWTHTPQNMHLRGVKDLTTYEILELWHLKS